MSRQRRRHNNMLILLVAFFGILLLSSKRLTQQPHSLPLLPETPLMALVFANVVIELQGSQWHSTPPLASPQLAGVLQAWQSAQLLPVATPEPVPLRPVAVDLYLQGFAEAQTTLLYPADGLIKLHGQPQWWRLVNQPVSELIPSGVQ
ncbi:hypothetical protein [Ferrimonas senticii]|uniref:hypothetical protein n=1 Tax=Ferrimonas senticii TaxID=394566 RepID=UPI000427C910|nr:hypothetical protein [Ferrimonas senticii]